MVEFLSNRHEAISDQKNKFSTVRCLLEDASRQYDEVYGKLTDELAKLKLKQRHSLIDPDKFLTSEKIDLGRTAIEEFRRELSVLESKQSDVNDADPIKAVVIEIFKGKIGEGFTRKELEEIYKDGEKRYEKSVPPGFKDKSKQGSYLVEDREFLRKFGDLLLWKEIIRKAKSDGIESIVLVSGDVKEDWWLEKRGKKLGPRKELLNEIYTEAECVRNFYMYDTASFLKHAKSHLKASVQESSISQAKALIEKGRKSRAVSEEGYVLLRDCIRQAAVGLEKLRVGIGRSVQILPPVKLEVTNMYSCLTEIFANAVQHGIHNYIGVQAKDRGEVIALRFKNRLQPSSTTAEMSFATVKALPFRGQGLSLMREVMAREGVAVGTVLTERDFAVELIFHKSKFFPEAK